MKLQVMVVEKLLTADSPTSLSHPFDRTLFDLILTLADILIKFDFFTPIKMKVQKWESKNTSVEVKCINGIYDIGAVTLKRSIQHHVISSQPITLPPLFKVYKLEEYKIVPSEDLIILYLCGVDTKEFDENKHITPIKCSVDPIAESHKVNYITVTSNKTKALTHEVRTVMSDPINTMTDFWGESLHITTETTVNVSTELAIFYDIYAKYGRVTSARIDNIDRVSTDMIHIEDEIKLLLKRAKDPSIRDQLNAFLHRIQKIKERMRIITMLDE